MNRLYKILSLCMAGCLLLTGCNLIVEEMDSLGKEIRLESAVEPNTKGSLIDEQSQMLNPGQAVGVTITGASALHENIRWTVGESGELKNSSDPVRYVGKNVASIYAYHPYNDNWNDFTTGLHSFSVSADQSAGGFANSDLLWATATSNNDQPIVTLHFKHLLSKVNVFLYDENGKATTGSEIRLTNVEKTVSFSNGAASTLKGDVGSIVAGLDTEKATAIVAPQVLAAGLAVIKATIGGKDYEYRMDATTNMMPGKSYSFSLKATGDGSLVLLHSNIDPWEDEEIGGGDGNEGNDGDEDGDGDGDGDETTGFNKEPYFSETVELMGLVFRLAGVSEYNTCHVPVVYQSADSHFKNMKNHEAVTLAKEYATHNVRYDAVTGYANQLIFDTNGKIIFDPDYLEGSNTSFDRWKEVEKTNMLSAINSFYEESGFHEWFLSTKKYQDEAVAHFKSVCDMDYGWFDRFYGKQDKLSSRIILSFFIGSHNNGISLKRKDGTFLLTPTMGSFSQDGNGRVIYSGDLSTLVHEFSHPYCNPLIDKYWSSISSKANEVFGFVRSIMASQAYGNSKTMMCETLVRSCEISYYISHDMENMVSRMISYEESKGFYLVQSIVKALEKRTASCKTLDEYMPHICEAVNSFDTSILLPPGNNTNYTGYSESLLPGKFSVAPGKQVQFTKGNLYWTGNGWELEDTQMSIQKDWDPRHISLFFWTSTPEAARAERYSGSGTNSLNDHFFCDGTSSQRSLTVDGIPNLRTLSGNADSEMLYLLYERKYAAFLMKTNVQLQGIGKCIVIAPDDYEGTISFGYDADSWAVAESEGLVCLAPTGMRWGTEVQDFSSSNFWTSSAHDSSANHAYYIGYINGLTTYPSYASRNAGMAIRLVKDVK